VLQSLGTIFILLIVCMRKRQLPRLKQLIAIVLAIFGVVLLNTNGDFSTITMSKAVLFYGLCSALGVGFYSMLSEGIIRKYGLYSVAGLGMIIGGLAILPFSRPWETYVPITVPLVVGMFGVIILGTAIAFGFYLKGVSIVGSLMGSLLGAMEPVSAVVISAVILKSNFTAVELIAFALIIGNVFWLCLQERTPKNKKISKT
ncbi:MAG: EamA family transporter, partial [Bacillota bacterium]